MTITENHQHIEAQDQLVQPGIGVPKYIRIPSLPTCPTTWEVLVGFFDIALESI